MNVIELIETAFAGRSKPAAVVAPGHPQTDEYQDALAFDGLAWQDLRIALLEEHSDAVFGFSPDAFCYFLPGIFCAGMRESRPDLLVNHSLIMGLDRAGAPSSWDNFFRSRWPQLTPAECHAAQQWVLWLSDSVPPAIAPASLTRAFDTLELLATQGRATPLASHKKKSK